MPYFSRLLPVFVSAYGLQTRKSFLSCFPSLP